jgi:hypothetical protein
MRMLFVFLRGLVFGPVALVLAALAIPCIPLLLLVMAGHMFCEEVLGWEMLGKEEIGGLFGPSFSSDD